MASERITIFGGSGFVGRYLVRALCKRDYRVRVATRRPHLSGDLRVAGVPGQVQLTQANVRNRESVARAVEDADGVVNLVGILFEAGKQKFNAIQANGAKIVAEEAAKAGVAKFVQMSAIGADPESHSAYGRTKAAGEANAREAFPAATVIRPSIVFGPEDEFFNRFANMFRYTPPFAPLPLLFGGGRTQYQPVYVGDVADAIVAALQKPEAAGRTYELGGPKVYTFKELLKLIMREIDRERMLVYTPWFGATTMAYAGWITGKLPFVEPFLTPDQVKLMRTDNVVGSSADVGTIQDLGVTPDTVEAIIPTYLYRYRKAGQFHERVV